jgi:RecA/RadA recombinase
MPRRKSEPTFDPNITIDESDLNKFEESFDKALDKFLKNDHSSSIIDNLKPLTYLNTGIPGLNYLLSGKPYSGGLPLSGKSTVWYGEQGSGKQNPIWSKVLTPKGFVTMGSLKVGDEICTPDGKVAHITHIFPQGIKPVYKITFNDDAVAYSGLEHLWNVKGSTEKKWMTLTLQEIINRGVLREGLKKDGHKKPLKWMIPKIESTVMYSNVSEEDIHPYILGVLIGDGSLNNNATIFSNPDIDIYISNKVSSLIFNGYKLTKNNSNACPNYMIVKDKNNKNGRNIYNNKIKELGLNLKSSDKFIPEIYKNSTYEQRKELLAGLMDTDGSVSYHGSTYSTISEKLANDVVDLVRSLGGLSKIRVYDRTKDDKGIEYNITIKTPFNPFTLPRKADKWTTRNYNRRIKNVEYYGEEECQCIKLDTEEGLYIIDDYIVTHNSSFAAHMIKIALDTNFLVLFLNSEQGLTPERLEEFGIDLKSKNLRHLDPNDIEEAFEIIESTLDLLISHNMIKKGVLIVWDSIAANTSEESLTRGMRDMEIATDTKVLKRGFHRIRKKLRVLERCGIIFVQQSRLKIGNFSGYGDKYDLPGGQVLKHYCDGLVRFARGKIFKDDNGQEIKISTPSKYRLATPRQQIVLNFDYTSLFTKEESIRSLVELLTNSNYLGRSGSYVYFKDSPDNNFYKKDLVKELLESVDTTKYDELLEKCENYIVTNKNKISVIEDVIEDPENIEGYEPLEVDEDKSESTD